MSRIAVAIQSAARAVSASCSERALTLGILSRSYSSAWMRSLCSVRNASMSRAMVGVGVMLGLDR